MEPFKSSKALKGKKKIVIAHHYTSRSITLKGTEDPKIPVTGHRGSRNTSYLAQGVQKYQLQGTGGPKKR